MPLRFTVFTPLSTHSVNRFTIEYELIQTINSIKGTIGKLIEITVHYLDKDKYLINFNSFIEGIEDYSKVGVLIDNKLDDPLQYIEQLITLKIIPGTLSQYSLAYVSTEYE